MDQASHFGGAASSIGSGGETGEGGGEFREGLDATERECGYCKQYLQITCS